MSPVWQNDSGSIGTKTSVSDSRKGVRKEGQPRIWRKRKRNSERKWAVTNARDEKKRHWEKKDSV